ncbi:MAG: hypothetical protein ACYTF9_02085 [Planctomycetota bacterium]|jgi:hypothetical protein
MLTRRLTVTCLAALALMLGGCVDFGLLAFDPFTTPPDVIRLEDRSYASPPIVVRHSGPDGWTLLANRRDHAAFERFRAQIESDPRDGRARIGYALAAGLLGESQHMERAIHHALLVDPMSFARFEVEPRLHARVDRLADRWSTCVSRRPTTEGLLAVGAMRLMTGQVDEAHRAVQAIDELDGRHAATISLHRLVDEAILIRDAETVYVRNAPPFEPLPTMEAPVATPSLPVTDPIEAPEMSNARPPVPVDTPVPAVEVDAPPAAPREPVDYDALRADLLTMSETLDRFSAKLIERMRAKTPDQ